MEVAAIVLDPCFDSAAAAEIVDLCERFGHYRMYAEHEQHDTEIGRGLAQRHDALTNFLRSGAAGGEPPAALAVRTSYFREEYAYGTDERISGIGPFLHHDAFLAAARAIHGRPVIEPAIAYANLMVPGQELAVHTDVPEFRGANRKVVPQWLLVVMHHSGLFEEYRMPIATAIAWFHDCDGGALSYWPAGPDAPVARHRVRYNTAIVLDTDSVFHGVDRIADVAPEALPRIRPGTTLDYAGARTWALHDAAGTEHARYDWEQLRFSVSWKAYCFEDVEQRDAWRDHRADLTIDVILDRLVDDLRARERVAGDVARDADLGRLLIDEYIAFPGVHRNALVVHKLILYRSTARASYALIMSFVILFDDESTTVVSEADSYEQEGPLTTFFDRNGGGRLASAFTVRVASFRTSRIVEVRRDAGQSSVMSASSTTTSQRCAHSPQR